ncbi:MAG: flagellar hook-length control protein FliK, partial [Planctomycetota bacterium]
MTITHSVSSVGDRSSTITSFTSPFASIDGAGFADLLAAVTPPTNPIGQAEISTRETPESYRVSSESTSEERKAEESSEIGPDRADQADHDEPLQAEEENQDPQLEAVFSLDVEATLKPESKVDAGIETIAQQQAETAVVEAESTVETDGTEAEITIADASLIEQGTNLDGLTSLDGASENSTQASSAIAASSKSENRKSTNHFELKTGPSSQSLATSEAESVETLETNANLGVPTTEDEVIAEGDIYEEDGRGEEKADAKSGDGQRVPSLESYLRRNSDPSLGTDGNEPNVSASKPDAGAPAEIIEAAANDYPQDQAKPSSKAEISQSSLASATGLAKSSASSRVGSEGAAKDPSVGSLNGPSSPTNTAKPENAKGAQDAGQSSLSQIKLIQRVSRAFQHLGPDGGNIRLRLAPAELGTVRIEMAVSQNRIEARVVAETEAAESLLREHLGTLRSRLESQGMTIEKLGAMPGYSLGIQSSNFDTSAKSSETSYLDFKKRHIGPVCCALGTTLTMARSGGAA